MSRQRRAAPDPRTLIGRGKLQELVSRAYHEDADLLVFDRELNPAQARDIEEETKLKIIDRTQLILDIFAQNARGREAQVQVELAQLQYQVTRLAGRGPRDEPFGWGHRITGTGGNEARGRPPPYPRPYHGARGRCKRDQPAPRPEPQGSYQVRGAGGRARRLHERRKIDAL